MRYVNSNNPYYISKHKYLELKNFCLQYDRKKCEMKSLEFPYNSPSVNGMPHSGKVGQPTEQAAARIVELSKQLDIIEQSAKDADPEIWQYILKNVTQGIPYERLAVPCGFRKFSNARVKFFWYLSKRR